MTATTTPGLELNNGVTMPALRFGVFQTPPDETRDAVRAALATGYRHIDTAAAYGNERQVGAAVYSSELEGSEVFLETKIWISDYGYDETLHGLEKSARKLGVEQMPDNQRKLEATEALGKLAGEAGLSLVELPIAFALNYSAVTSAIIGPRTIEQLDSQTPAAEIALDAAILDRIDEIVQPGLNLNPADTSYGEQVLAPPLRRR
jgi:aryl-alcohol dehydrogenase-like predicted oxidoreductase